MLIKVDDLQIILGAALLLLNKYLDTLKLSDKAIEIDPNNY